MPAWCSTWRALVDGLDVASARRAAGRARRRHATRARSASPGPARRDARACAGGRRRHPRQRRIGARDASCSRRIGAALGAARRAWRCASIPTSSSSRSGMKMGGGPKQFGVDAERVPALLARDRRSSASPSRAFTSSAARRTCAPRRSAKRSARRIELALRARRARAGAGAHAQHRRRLRHPVLSRRAAARPRADRRATCATLLPERAARAAAGASW